MTELQLKEFIDIHATSIYVSDFEFTLFIPNDVITLLTWKIGMKYIFTSGLNANIKHSGIIGIDMMPVCQHFGINHLNFIEND